MTDNIAHIASEVARQLATARVIGASAFISTPLTYVGGAPVVVRLDPIRSKFFVSDAGIGVREADLIGGSRLYRRIAEQMATRFGVRFDREALFEAEVSQDELIASVAAIANASKGAVDQTAFKLTEKAAQDARIAVTERLQAAFAREQITMDFRIKGSSNDEWDFDAAVKLPTHLTLIHVVSPAPASVNSAVARFVDMSDLPDEARPRLVGALQDRGSTNHIKLLQRSARIIDFHATPDVWQRAAA
jgi:hypothetical protein